MGELDAGFYREQRDRLLEENEALRTRLKHYQELACQAFEHIAALQKLAEQINS
jgi:hypothetical protein